MTLAMQRLRWWDFSVVTDPLEALPAYIYSADCINW
jgi:hypothetical protein